ncbi:hypothetical protein HYH03_012713 [Edaphochlamys debaryana]|uniref:Uncharacterized protein n=1 Tax=Edaphochlamys debaryana TaxID=47281 RepID=A0A836BV59_9CHLO|nr:hypothetical protein HYH03_012713 [Edaphochlamys debaryana]|eukprot:KAG2488713.1 hypothetical protein HYH03_012713 [Edaphochlamys debaryana]
MEEELPGTSGDAGAGAELLGRRGALLQEAFVKALEYGMQDPSREEFGDSFPDYDSALVDALYNTFQQMLAGVRSHCHAEFGDLCTEHHIHDHLRTLDEADGLPSTAAAADAPTPIRDRPNGELRSPGLGVAAATPSGVNGDSAVAEAVSRAESAARLHALRQEAVHLQDLLERARTTEARLTEALALRKGGADKMAATYHRVVSDVKQVYDITRAWPTAPKLGGASA